MVRKDEQSMTKRVFAIITGVFIFGIFLALVVLNSFFHENTGLLNERNKVDSLNKELVKENLLLRKRMPSMPQGALIEGMRVAPDPETAQTPAAKYILTLWVKNPTDQEIPAVRGIVYIQGLSEGGHLDTIIVSIPAIAPGERRLFASRPLTLGTPGSKIEIVASLWQEPGVAKLIFALPEAKPTESTPPKKDETKDPKDTKDTQDKSTAGVQTPKADSNNTP